MIHYVYLVYSFFLLAFTKFLYCMAYANLDINGQGSGYATWFGDLIDIRQFAVGG